MPTTRFPRSGSMQFWPRKRARRIYARIRSWVKSDDNKPLGFAGYKVGMTHCLFLDNKKTSMTKNQEVPVPVTVIECPPLKIVDNHNLLKPVPEFNGSPVCGYPVAVAPSPNTQCVYLGPLPVTPGSRGVKGVTF